MADQAQDPARQLERAEVLRELARLDGRGDPTHPFHGTFTGLGRPGTRLMALEARVLDLELAIAKLTEQLDAADAAPPDELEDTTD